MLISAPSDYRKAAERRLPRFLFDYIDGGAVAVTWIDGTGYVVSLLDGVNGVRRNLCLQKEPRKDSNVRFHPLGLRRISADHNFSTVSQIDLRVKNHLIALGHSRANFDRRPEIPHRRNLAQVHDAVVDNRDAQPLPVEDNGLGGNDQR